MGFFEWWSDLPAWLRYGTALIFLAISTGLWFAAASGPGAGPSVSSCS